MATGVNADTRPQQTTRGERRTRPERPNALMQSPDRMLMAGATSDALHGKADRRSRAPATGEQIRCRAYEIYCDRNGGPGDALSDWLAAENELRGTAAPAAAESEARRETALLSPTDGDPTC